MDGGHQAEYTFGVSDTHSDLASFLEEYSGGQAPSFDADVFDALGIDGDDAFEFMDRFTARFGISADNYRWYFHHGEEGWNLGGIFFRPPYRRVKRIPVTTATLVEAIETRHWPLRYPEHELPSVRWDIRLNQLLIIPLLIPVGLAVWNWFMR